jgi:hypothetical protein
MTHRTVNIGKISTIADEDGISELSSIDGPNTLSIFRRKYSLGDEDESVLLHNAVSYVLNGAMGQRNHRSLEIDTQSHEMEGIRPSPRLSNDSMSMEVQEQLSQSNSSSSSSSSKSSSAQRERENNTPAMSTRTMNPKNGKYLCGMIAFFLVIIGIVGGIAGWAISYARSNQLIAISSEENVKSPRYISTSNPSSLSPNDELSFQILKSPSSSPSNT